MLVANYQTKKQLKASIGKPFNYTETSLFNTEYTENQMMTVVGPSAYDRKFYANVWCKNGMITKVK